jgi:hypothetical protein
MKTEQPKQEKDYTALLQPVGTKQETLEEASNNEDLYLLFPNESFIAGAKWQKEQDKNKYSEEDIINALHSVELKDKKDYSKIYNGMKEWFEKSKKKIIYGI